MSLSSITSSADSLPSIPNQTSDGSTATLIPAFSESTNPRRKRLRKLCEIPSYKKAHIDRNESNKSMKYMDDQDEEKDNNENNDEEKDVIDTENEEDKSEEVDDDKESKETKSKIKRRDIVSSNKVSIASSSDKKSIASSSDKKKIASSSGKISNEEKLLNKVRNMKSIEKIVTLAIKSRKTGFKRDPRIITGDIRDEVNTGYNPSILIFEVVRRSSGKTWRECKSEWSANEDVGIRGWTCVGGRSKITGHGNMWIDDDNSEWTRGQCICMLSCPIKGAIKYRYSVKNDITGEVITLGSTCIKNWGKSLAARANATYAISVLPSKKEVAGKKWLFV